MPTFVSVGCLSLHVLMKSTKVQNPRRLLRVDQANNAPLLATPGGVAVLPVSSRCYAG